MKKLKIILSFLFVSLLVLSFWIAEPYGWNPFSETPIAYSNSEMEFSCIDQFPDQLLLEKKADSIVNNAMILKDFVGVSAGIYKQDCGTWITTAGYSEKSIQQQADKQTLHRLASIAKPMTAVAIMQLYEKGTINLDVPIQTYLSDYPKSKKGEITIRQLLKHTSGVAHYRSTWDAISFSHYKNLTEALEVFKNRPLSFVPGTNYEYTSYGYIILGAIIERVSGLSFQEYMRKYVWQPAGMNHTDIEDRRTVDNNKANLYIKTGGTFIKGPNTDLSGKYAAGGVHSTAEDLLKFGKAILENKLVDSTTLMNMVQATDTLKKGTPYGFGWFVHQSKRLGRIISHGGSHSGTSTYFQIFLDQNLAAVTLANNFDSDNEVYWLTRDLSNLFVDSAVVLQPIEYTQPQDDVTLEKIVGVYEQTENKERLEVIKKGNQLFVEIKPYPILPIFPKSNIEFFYRHFDGQLKFMEGSSTGKIEEVVYHYKGEPNTYRRLR